MFDFENLVIEGGGTKGVCIGGTLRVLEKYNILSKIKRYAGTSVGALIATLLADAIKSTKSTVKLKLLIL